MFEFFSQKMREVKIISALCQAAEAYAIAESADAPGAEHFVMAALDLPDGTARSALMALGHSPEDFAAAVAKQYEDALENAGVTVPEPDGGQQAALKEPAANSRAGLYRAQPSGDQLLQALANMRGKKPLESVDVLLAAIEAKYGVVPRAFRALGIDRYRLEAVSRVKQSSV